MNKNKFFIKRKNTYLHETELERDILKAIGSVFAAVVVLGSSWLLICLLNALIN